MIDMSPATPSPAQAAALALTAPLTQDQQCVVDLLVRVFSNSRRWPYFYYLEAKLDTEGLEARSVLASFPTLDQPSDYGAVSYDRSALGRDSEVRLTALGLHHVGGQLGHHSQELHRWFFLVLGYLVERRRRFAQPRELTAPEVTSPQLAPVLQQHEEFLDDEDLALVGQLLQAESWRLLGSGSASLEGDWTREITREVLDYDGVATIEAYVEVMADRLAVPAPPIAPSVTSPLGLVAALDYLNLAWRVAFDTPGPVEFSTDVKC